MNASRRTTSCARFPYASRSRSPARSAGWMRPAGTLFFNIAAPSVRARTRAIVLLENVRNLAGPRHDHEWAVIIDTLREEGYHVADRPAIFSPHLLPPGMGGAPQVRERVFITATYAPELVCGSSYVGPLPAVSMKDRFPVAPSIEDVWGQDLPSPIRTTCSAELKSHTEGWHLEHLLDDSHNIPGCELSDAETLWIDAWDEFVRIMRGLLGGQSLPGHPIWADSWRDFRAVDSIDWTRENIRVPKKLTMPTIDPALPAWKKSHLRNNYLFFQRHFRTLLGGLIDGRLHGGVPAVGVAGVAGTGHAYAVGHGDAPKAVRHRAKPTYLPALVAITQTSIVGPRRRRLSPRETARLETSRYVHLSGPAAGGDLQADGQRSQCRCRLARDASARRSGHRSPVAARAGCRTPCP